MKVSTSLHVFQISTLWHRLVGPVSRSYQPPLALRARSQAPPVALILVSKPTLALQNPPDFSRLSETRRESVEEAALSAMSHVMSMSLIVATLRRPNLSSQNKPCMQFYAPGT